LVGSEMCIRDSIQAVQAVEDPDQLRIGEWSLKDILGHITFWHENLARNTSALLEGKAPNFLKGSLADLNRASAEQSRGMDVAQIVERLRQAQAAIRVSILALPADRVFPYRKKSRELTPAEHLELVRDHIGGHLKDIELAQRKNLNLGIDKHRAGDGAEVGGCTAVPTHNHEIGDTVILRHAL
ncbi:MAG: maleylpyruvate isomerase N-terminal domain-containing protein, partial [Anaerolineae bacterium]|nr:maleylpyruvate isomerase N-terminal domain-containing protein [Anaerolineae bacterium]